MEATERVRRLQTIHDFDGARRAVEDGLVADPGAPELLEAAARLKRHGERSLEKVEAPVEVSRTTLTSGSRAFLQAAWAKASALAGRPGRARETKIGYSSARDRLTPAAQTNDRAREEIRGPGAVAVSEKTPTGPGSVPPAQPQNEDRPLPSDGRARRLRLPLIALIAGTVVAAIVLALILSRARKRDVLAPRHEPAASSLTSVASLRRDQV
jgi:hypothetical protein